MIVLRRPTWRWPRRRPLFGIGSTPAPSLLFVLLGVAIGPSGAGLVGPSQIDRLQAIVSVTLAALGVYAGLGFRHRQRQWDRSVLHATLIEATVSALLIGTGLWLLLHAWQLPLAAEPPLFAALAAIAATASAAGATGRIAEHVADLDDIVLIAAGAFLLAALDAEAVRRLVLTVVAAAAAGVAGHLLFEGAAEAERGVFVGGVILLLGGTAAYLGTSPLLTGLLAAAVWVRLPGPADRISAADLDRLQHVLLAFVLVVAGASISWSVAVLWIGAALALLRIAAKVLASFVTAPVARTPPTVLVTALMPPGVIGIALALHARQVLAAGAGTLLGAVAVALAVSEVAAAFLASDEPAEHHA